MNATLAQALGRNARELRKRAGATLDDVALYARLHGLPWSTGRVSDFESGKVTPNLETVLALASALARATDNPVKLSDLMTTDVPVSINDKMTMNADQLDAASRGNPITGDLPDLAPLPARAREIAQRMASLTHEWKILPAERRRGLDPVAYTRTLATLRESDVRVIKQLDITREVGAAIMVKLWGHNFSDERDRRGGRSANAQRRGQISRQLKAEMEEVI